MTIFLLATEGAAEIVVRLGKSGAQFNGFAESGLCLAILLLTNGYVSSKELNSWVFRLVGQKLLQYFLSLGCAIGLQQCRSQSNTKMAALTAHRPKITNCFFEPARPWRNNSFQASSNTT